MITKISSANEQVSYSGTWGMIALHQLNDILKAFEAGVFVVSADIPEHQLKEIQRELGVMSATVTAGYNEAGIPDREAVPGTAHFERGA